MNFKNLKQFLDFHNILFKMTVKLTKNVLVLINEQLCAFTQRYYIGL